MKRLTLSVCTALALTASTLRADDSLRQLIDAEVKTAWEREKITPAKPADDATFLRRIHLDLIGTIPTHDEAKAFLADKDEKKRDKLIDRLLADPRFGTHQAQVWDLVLFGRHPILYDAVTYRPAFRAWLAEKFNKNEPYDRWVRELLLAEDEAPSLYYVQYRSQPEETAVAVSRTFLGTQLQCARCHDHPYEAWSQRDFYGLAAFFARLVVVDRGGTGGRRFLIGEKSTGEVLFTGPAIDQKPGKKGEPIRAKLLGGPVVEEPALPKDFKEPAIKDGKMPKPMFSRREKLAEWVTAKDNPYFARAIANRIWGQFMGRGLVDPIDDLTEKNRASHPKLLDAMTKQMIEKKFDLKWLMREIVSSKAYQLGADGPVKEAKPAWFERARVRPLSAEELLATMRVATGFDDAAHAAGEKPGQERLPAAILEYMVMFFGEPTNGRGDFQPSLSEHLFLNNSDQLHSLIRPRKGNLADSVLRSTAPWGERVDRMFLTVLSRPPRDEERKAFVAHFTSGGKPEERVDEAIWALVNCSEFRFNR
jgi:Protein of unknown function (DUF1549)/Protein of unknown function (DUF1553)